VTAGRNIAFFISRLGVIASFNHLFPEFFGPSFAAGAANPVMLVTLDGVILDNNFPSRISPVIESHSVGAILIQGITTDFNGRIPYFQFHSSLAVATHSIAGHGAFDLAPQINPLFPIIVAGVVNEIYETGLSVNPLSVII